ncbi:DUF805 domain-containing protein [Mesorhizobium sp. NBSH29]|uniref:DUF805 domain-containing protein n=1 Tax=Mesorhizobium sp. NBSH29 TaxID=2654249 RepID=UPI0018965D0D|nr:DUF805 domain-containing protein [Mesorhizobium sp. NBSH29]QPC86619.1 DUF805 domain-containing protein [Mesorhizobium sp. NBSH29]
MDWKYLFTSFEGRISRQPFWIGVGVLIAISVVAQILDGVLGTHSAGSGIGLVSGLAMLVCIYPAIALYAKRWHDRDKSGWWSLIGFVPIIGAVWMLVELGILKGTEGANQYGQDTLAGQ